MMQKPKPVSRVDHVIASGHWPNWEKPKSFVERIQPGGVLLIGILTLVNSVAITNITIETNNRETTTGDLARFTEHLEAARKVSDSVYLHPATCAPFGASGIERHFANDRERRQIVSHATSALEIAKKTPESASPAELFEIAEYLYAGGTLGLAMKAVEEAQKRKLSLLEKVDGYCIAAMVEAANGNGKKARDNVISGERVAELSVSLGDGERGLLLMKALFALAGIEMSETADRQISEQTQRRITSLAQKLGGSVPEESARALASMIAPQPAPPPTVDRRDSEAEDWTRMLDSIDELDGTTVRHALKTLIKILRVVPLPPAGGGEAEPKSGQFDQI